MKNITTILLMLIVSMGYGQTQDSTVTATSRSYLGVPMGKYQPDFADTTLKIQVRYFEKVDTTQIIKETLILDVNLDTIQKYYPTIYNRIMTRFFNQLQYDELELLSKQAAKERFFGYKKFFK